MKKAIVIVLLISNIAQGISVLLAMAYYELCKEQITAAFCENKNRPELQCNGRCFLKRQLKKASESEKRSLQLLCEKNEIAMPANQCFSLFDSRVFLITGHITTLCAGYLIDMPRKAPERPPSCN